ncbi:hypothetical protein LEP1GSC043_0477 [Leptospira weilii str. Ecochallenge]|uniref:Uncharacterized protein n=1 Tax=Leptospira weilii str. Ecochallenge TaxID=1049986 RepID=N1U811_9LEPT|nr:hypothetical protein LEP1GSC043_0477 [Leptospira weilii str. Ecochallenge]
MSNKNQEHHRIEKSAYYGRSLCSHSKPKEHKIRCPMTFYRTKVHRKPFKINSVKIEISFVDCF